MRYNDITFHIHTMYIYKNRNTGRHLKLEIAISSSSDENKMEIIQQDKD